MSNEQVINSLRKVIADVQAAVNDGSPYLTTTVAKSLMVDAIEALQGLEKLTDPNTLHANLLRGTPARLTEAHLKHLLGTPAACQVPPEGWKCSRTPGHDGPCAATPAPDACLQDRIYASDEVMSLNAEFGLTMEQLARLARVLPRPRDNVLQAVLRERNRLNEALNLACSHLTEEQFEAVRAAMPVDGIRARRKMTNAEIYLVAGERVAKKVIAGLDITPEDWIQFARDIEAWEPER